MSAFVLDCSVAVAWCFEDEASAATDALLDRLRVEGALVPTIWHLEFVNVLLQAERRGRIAMTSVTSQLALFARLPIVVDPEAPALAGAAILALARTHRLTSYDAAYLELAMRQTVPLATKDRTLVQAAATVGVAVLPGPSHPP